MQSPDKTKRHSLVSEQNHSSFGELPFITMYNETSSVHSATKIQLSNFCVLAYDSNVHSRKLFSYIPRSLIVRFSNQVSIKYSNASFLWTSFLIDFTSQTWKESLIRFELWLFLPKPFTPVPIKLKQCLLLLLKTSYITLSNVCLFYFSTIL